MWYLINKKKKTRWMLYYVEGLGKCQIWTVFSEKKKLCNKVPCHKTPFWIEETFSLQFKLKIFYVYVTELKMIAVKSFPYYFIHWNQASKTAPDSVRICKSSSQTLLLLSVIYLYFRPLWGRNFAEQFLNEASLLNEHDIVQNTRKSTIEWAKLSAKNRMQFLLSFSL